MYHELRKRGTGGVGGDLGGLGQERRIVLTRSESQNEIKLLVRGGGGLSTDVRPYLFHRRLHFANLLRTTAIRGVRLLANFQWPWKCLYRKLRGTPIKACLAFPPKTWAASYGGLFSFP